MDTTVVLITGANMGTLDQIVTVGAGKTAI